MNATYPRLVGILMAMVGIPLVMVIFRYIGFWGSGTMTLQPDIQLPCIFQLINDDMRAQGVITYWTGGVWITAKHVLINPHIKTDIHPPLGSQGFFIRFQDRNYYPQFIVYSSGDLIFLTVKDFNTHYCNHTHLDGLVTYESGVQKIIPVIQSGMIIDYTPYPGQSGSPVFVQEKLMGVVSRRFEGGSGAVIELLD